MASDPTLVRTGLAEQVVAAVAAVRDAPQAPGTRVKLFQLDCICGNWRRARSQLETLVALDTDAAPFVHLYLGLIAAEAERESVFTARAAPVSLGEPPAWLAMLVRALEHDASGKAGSAASLRGLAFEAAPAMPGSADGGAFGWIMDADARLGPVLEVVVNAQYRWLPLARLRLLHARPPETLRDLVWQPVRLTLRGGVEIDAFVPARYPGSATHDDEAVRMARATVWSGPDDAQIAHGQRLFATDGPDLPLLDLRRLELTTPVGEDGEGV